jgi:hypothetical protein
MSSHVGGIKKLTDPVNHDGLALGVARLRSRVISKKNAICCALSAKIREIGNPRPF